MTINKLQEGNTLIVALDGRLDTMTSPELEKELKAVKDSLKDKNSGQA